MPTARLGISGMAGMPIFPVTKLTPPIRELALSMTEFIEPVNIDFIPVHTLDIEFPMDENMVVAVVLMLLNAVEKNATTEDIPILSPSTNEVKLLNT